MPRSVSKPTMNSSTTEATAQKPYSSTDTGKVPIIGNNPWGKPGPLMPPSRWGPTTMPAVSSPRQPGRLKRSKRMLPSLAAKRIRPSWMTRSIIRWVMPASGAAAASLAIAGIPPKTNSHRTADRILIGITPRVRQDRTDMGRTLTSRTTNNVACLSSIVMLWHVSLL